MLTQWVRLGMVRFLLLAFALTGFGGCSTKIQPFKSDQAQIEYKTLIYDQLVSLPPPPEPIVMVVY